jgi:hypothetical protein
MTLELKVKGGAVSPEQRAFQQRAIIHGWHSVIMPCTMDAVSGVEWCIKEIEQYLKGTNA